MPYIPRIILPNVRLIHPLSAAPVGSLLQIAAQGFTARGNHDPALVGIRAELPASNGTSQGFVFLEGALAGGFHTVEELLDRPAIDITDLAVVTLQDPAPLGPTMHRVTVGDVCRATIRDETPFLCMAVGLGTDSQASLEGYMRLEGHRCGLVAKATQPLYVGRAVVIPIDAG